LEVFDRDLNVKLTPLAYILDPAPMPVLELVLYSYALARSQLGQIGFR